MNIFRNWKSKPVLNAQILAIISFFTLSNIVFCQTTISLQTIIDSALVYNPMIKASDSRVQQQQHLINSAINLPSPEVLMQNPTGTFYTFGVSQSFDFPTVYISQRNIQKENVKLAEMSQNRDVSDLKYQLSVLYWELHFEQQFLLRLEQQDSIYGVIAQNAQRSFEAGTIDYIQASFANLQAVQVKTNLYETQANYSSLLQKIKFISGIKTDFITENNSNKLFINSIDINQNNSLLLANQELVISQKSLKLEQQKLLPGFTFGFLNQGEKNTAFRNQFFAGVKIPLWIWQYKGNLSAAKSQIEISEYNSENQILTITIELERAQLIKEAYKKAIDYYELDGSKRAESLIDAANRFYKSGNYSVTEYLRNLNDAADIKRIYLENLKKYNQSLIYIQYLTGNL